MTTKAQSLPIVFATAGLLATSSFEVSADVLADIKAQVDSIKGQVSWIHKKTYYNFPMKSNDPYTGATNIVTLIRDKAKETQGKVDALKAELSDVYSRVRKTLPLNGTNINTQITGVLNAVNDVKGDIQAIGFSEGVGDTFQMVQDQYRALEKKPDNLARLNKVRESAEKMLEQTFELTEKDVSGAHASGVREEMKSLVADVERLFDAAVRTENGDGDGDGDFVNFAVLKTAIDNMPDVALHAIDNALGSMPGLSSEDFTDVISDLMALADADTCELVDGASVDLELATKRVSQFGAVASLVGALLERIGSSTSDLEFELGIHGYVGFSGKVNCVTLIGGLLSTAGESANAVVSAAESVFDGCEADARHAEIIAYQRLILENQVALEEQILAQ